MAEEKDDLGQSQELLKTIQGQASSGNHIGILKSVSSNPPNCKDQDLQKKIALPVVTALSKLKKSNIDSLLKELDEKAREVLLAYVYYGFQSQPKTATEFLNWQQAIVKMDGVGVIVRVATNIKRNILVAAEDTTV
mmetsp:Transcript_9802/g.14930  ORF Transcript_9802/g.14930 Transcript_9802/m.14930 type:complete len:136 (+) Transcript_9802:91-498(+)|eukprot:CAMPEP_0202712822 /NCGR_PEP_ID=MMETSP1385-20130828/46238_1 /ASSEMBLY_ACC=CAM_ASM_000861 /TAXON_ID=933848 /ORGANISM="Elphidium margaritaceum" /LENGTH=135 /DNA_ID=CAMNT_0049372985 /DNA_START=76 /DNA_END=483 /DNA_ORIENTATION=+